MCSIKNSFLAGYAEQLEGRPLRAVSIAMRTCFLTLGCVQETENRVVNLESDDPDGVEAMIRFMYGLDYLDNLDSGSAMLLQVKVYQLATSILFPG